MAENGDSKGVLAVMLACILLVAGALIYGRVRGAPAAAGQTPVTPSNKPNGELEAAPAETNVGPEIIFEEPTHAQVRLHAREMKLVAPMELVTDPQATGGRAIGAIADHANPPGGTHNYKCEHWPADFSGLAPAERKHFAGIKKAVEVDFRFAFDIGTAEVSFDVPEKGDYRIYMRAKWCCSCGNSFYFTVDDGPVRVFEENGGTYGAWIWGAYRDGGKVAKLDLDAGPHVLKLAFREDGARLDQVLLTTRDDDRWSPTTED
ncbi:MAG: hypothetical protein IIA00_08945 [Proteobacteria bacterium]|nr:hypothetical protein [Pseudomonadota bacterium]